MTVALTWPEPTDDHDDELDAAVDRADPAELLRWIDGCCAARDWHRLAALRDRSVAARHRGRQLGGLAAHAEYRLALEAPAAWVAPVLVEGTGRGAPGPLPEVAAKRIAWTEVADLLQPGPPAGLFAWERHLAGDTGVVDDDRARRWAEVLDAPWELGGWEPEWPSPTFRSDELEDPAPPWPTTGWQVHDLEGADGGEADPEGSSDLLHTLDDLVDVWRRQSNGRTHALAVHGDVSAALGRLGPARVSTVELSSPEALGWLGWAAASGGAHGARRGRAPGRARALWMLAVLGGASEDWPLDVDELGGIAAELDWWCWDAGEPAEGWWLRLAVQDRPHGWAAVLSAVDQD